MLPKKVALISGVSGQDGFYLAEFLMKNGYTVHGILRRPSPIQGSRINGVGASRYEGLENIHTHFGDITDFNTVLSIVEKTQPDEIYNLAAQSHVQVSFDAPEYTANVDALGALRFLEAIRILKLAHKTKFYQASSSELFGTTSISPQSETTAMEPCSPYGISKLFAYWATKNYRQAYGIFAVNGILFNHESPRRNNSFVTRKITQTAAEIYAGLTNTLVLGRLDTRRDWGHARDYVEGMWLMLQAHQPEDYVLATGKSTSVRDFVSMTFRKIGRPLEFQGKGLDEVGICRSTGQILVRCCQEQLRPMEIDHLVGDSSKARQKLGWAPKVGVEELCEEMLAYDFELLSRSHYVSSARREEFKTISTSKSNH